MCEMRLRECNAWHLWWGGAARHPTIHRSAASARLQSIKQRFEVEFIRGSSGTSSLFFRRGKFRADPARHGGGNEILQRPAVTTVVLNISPEK